MFSQSLLAFLCLVSPTLEFSVGPRVSQPLDGVWELQVGGVDDWKSVNVPGTFESQISIDFDGVANYRRTIRPFRVLDDRQVLIHFDAVATKTDVWFNGQKVGSHLGGWTPFRVNVTELARDSLDDKWEILVKVDELPGHNTQGFLPIIAPHFGGIWQKAKLMVVLDQHFDDLASFVHLDRESGVLECKFPNSMVSDSRIKFKVRERGAENWLVSRTITLPSSEQNPIGRFDIELSRSEVARIQNWSPNNPLLYEIRIEHLNGAVGDSFSMTTGFKNLEIEGDRFVLNGSSVNFRGLLNWGYQPPGTAPPIDEKSMRSEIQLAKERGFNLMKFCLWIPPKRYLQLCDELGMMAWIEYPTWHPDFSEKHLADLKTEYGEFFRFDRIHPSVMLRSLTCETGPSAELKVIQSLYDQCKFDVPDAIVVDDSSWIAWNRVFDFYDDHPYGNNHQWVEELARLRKYIADRELKPLMLGEAITADTWTPPEWFDAATKTDDHWQPHFLESSRAWIVDAEKRYGSSAVQRLRKDSMRYAMLQRKYQMETFRREVTGGGYVVSVIRDMPKAGMGLLDFRGQSKWAPEDWAWHGDDMLLLQTKRDRRSFSSTVGLSGALFPVGPNNVKEHAENSVVSVYVANEKVLEQAITSVVGNEIRFSVKPPATSVPSKVEVHARLTGETGDLAIAANSWSFWMFPNIQKPAFGRNECMVVESLNEMSLQFLEQGGKVLLFANNQPNSFPMETHWFLRGGPIVSERCHELFNPRMLVDLQTFDLAGDVIRDINYIDQIDPLFMLWEAHDLDHIKTNGLLFHMPVGAKGNLFVSAIRHEDASNVATEYYVNHLLNEMVHGSICTDLDDATRGRQNLAQLRAEIGQRKVMLDQHPWKFRADTDQSGVESNWNDKDFDDREWAEIRIDRHWESQGNESLDNWAWYRTSVQVPEDWHDGKLFINFSGVDDYYDVYVDGLKVGSAGDIEKRETAFELRTSHEISQQVRAGQTIQISVAVYDWFGAGGIFRPVWLSTHPFSDQPRMLK